MCDPNDPDLAKMVASSYAHAIDHNPTGHARAEWDRVVSRATDTILMAFLLGMFAAMVLLGIFAGAAWLFVVTVR